ncbi:peptide MFS transporter [Flavobacterium alkalisoli]|uniref:Peptide MFS transporter n=1 Tax=Flavobacterium alkalisoli TaxID=2602769 RepID=A0A5B9FPK4_9FLAO|nr:peptide MFS transporter [Flavobacterium alkalisoli]QEE49233.1 peptide MFS transporter [Flavobacterium alkalisoli]
MSTTTKNDFFKTNVLGHPAGLFVLFFTEMWERFSYYGMRALLVMFLTASVMGDHPGWGWPQEHAFALFGSYTALVYLSTMLGGYFADKLIGYRWAVVVGAFLMTLGHASMAIETPFFIYLGLTLLVFGTGFFKPNMTSIISEMYKERPEKKDGAYTIFYMGVNAGAFFGILLCGYLGEKVGWSIGFGLAGIFMLFGLLQFYFSQNIFGDIGLKPKMADDVALANSDASEINTNVIDEKEINKIDNDKRVPFTGWQLAVIAICSILGLIWVINDPVSKISEGSVNFLSVGGYDLSNFAVLTALVLFFILLAYRLSQYALVTRQKLLAVTFFAALTFCFFVVFEQAPGTLTIFARDYTDRILTGGASLVFLIVNTLIAVVPLAIITWVLFKLFKQTFKNYALANIFLSLSFVIIWIITIWMLTKDFYSAGYLQLSDSTLEMLKIDKITVKLTEIPATWFNVLNSLFIITLAPLFSKWWESKFNPSANAKFGIGMILLGLGMGFIAYGGRNIAPGADSASVGMYWLIFVYLFHTMGELCISPVGLSYVSKLVPGRMIAFMFGVWYLAIAIANKVAGIIGENSTDIANEKGIGTFFMIIMVLAIAVGVVAILLNKPIKKLMHGVK